ncbi:unnamed protein product [Acanthoscelides obtectus]|uniref:Peptidase S1 domain-containing protein n=1 Tax=Acanthoscelides obtectus TaxID=200917 RepID=A0A9P0LAS3_ACAOB|nr:unnamed protein product [Acanthoscelides obtectus]CAK1679471.1 hypothetical protein AOBTE_LOCUS32272 [Acanthoscelides obtectus]
MYILSTFLILGAVLVAECKDLKKSAEARIINGEEVDVKNYPYMVKLFQGRTFNCGGTLITQRTVLTAGHCLYDSRTSLPLEDLEVHLEATREVIQPSKLIPHELYKLQTYTTPYDIAVIHLESPSELNTFPALNQQQIYQAPGTAVLLLGYGRTESGYPSSNLRGTKSFIRSLTEQHQIVISNGKSGTCFGDSGSPAIIFDGKMPIVVGVTSGVPTVKGRTCDVIHDAQSYTSVSDFHSWITKWII